MIVLWLYFFKRTQSLPFRSTFWHIYRLDYDIWTLLQNNPKGKEVSGGINWSWVGSCGSWLMGMWSFIILFTYFYMFIIFLFKKILRIYLFLAALGLHCCAWAFCSCSERGLLFVAVHGLLTAVASLVAEHRLYSEGSVVVVHGLSCSAARGIFLDQGSNPCPLHWQADS